MLDEATSRRDFLAASAAAFATLWLTADPQEVQASLGHAAHARQSPLPVAFEVFSPEEAADVEAIAAQIIPTDDTPGAREARVVYFIDNSLAKWASSTRGEFIKGLNELNAEAARRWPGAGRFAKLSPAAQIELLTAWDKERKPFFDAVRNATVTGMFSLPEYGGNADKAGWKLLGFEDRYVWHPPFGSYDVAANGGDQ